MRLGRLRRNGDIIYGQVTDSRDYEDSDDTRWVEVKYQFTVPGTSDVMEGKRNRITQTRVPNKGESVAVVYLNRKLYSLL